MANRYEIKVDGVLQQELKLEANLSALATGTHTVTVEAYDGATLVSSNSINVEVSADPMLLDTYPGAKAAYSLRSIKGGYVGEIFTLRRSSDNAEQAFTLVGGEFPTSDVLSFAGSGDAFGTKWNDVMGNGMDAIQTTASLQPKLVSAGVVETLNGKPAWNFNKSRFQVPNSKAYFKFLHSLQNTAIAVLGVDKAVTLLNPIFSTGGGSSGNVGITINYDNRSSWDRLKQLIGKGVSGSSVVDVDTTGLVTGYNQSILLYKHDPQNATAAQRNAGSKRNASSLNANTATASPVSTANATFDLEIGGVNISGYEMTGKYQELIIWDSNVPEQAQLDVNSFYSTF